jgi:hypothetical protein
MNPLQAQSQVNFRFADERNENAKLVRVGEQVILDTPAVSE